MGAALRVGLDATVQADGGMRTAFEGLVRSLTGPEEYSIIFKSAGPRILTARRFDVVHFPVLPRELPDGIPSVFTVHDLLHLHHPEMFSPGEREWRTSKYLDGIGRAREVAVPSEHVKADLQKQFGTRQEKITVIPWGPPTLFAPLGTVDVPQPFFLFPGATWPHKNHERLFEAIALAGDRLSLDLVCTGPIFPPLWPRLGAKIESLRLSQRVRFLGVVPTDRLRGLYRACRFVILPSLFEGAGLVLLEAWLDGAPVACSGSGGLEEYAGDAALLFDPRSQADMARALQRMSEDAPLREALKSRGRARLREFAWERAAQSYRSLYYRAAGREP